MDMALIPGSVMGLSAWSITEPVGAGGREEDATVQCLTCTFGAGVQREGRRGRSWYWGRWTGSEAGRRERSQKESWEQQHKGKEGDCDRLERIVPGKGTQRDEGQQT